ncbi:DUF1887 family protein [Rheinheimera sediminis]|uniref:Card1-like endonuclease domain-containing protein n=1 Tax=Rheinheimera sp. YQF-1 TaxID=2499626 RepID=UPI000FD74275|nr:DUF1887 family CARF protein [Rheinheimera sp. YQF-1]RVT47836.1 DUF1887 family protein [Rheinheimera sp. YQF-1]
MRIHLVVVTGQAMANLLPLLHNPPDVIACLTTKEMAAKQQALHKLIQSSDALSQCTVLDFAGLPSSNVQKIQEFGLECKASLEQQYPNASFDFDTTGGTKLMVLALATVFNDSDCRQLYLNSDINQLEYILPLNQPPAYVAGLLDSSAYLKATGHSRRRAQSDQPDWLDQLQHCKALSFALATQLNKEPDLTAQLIGQLNKLAADVARLPEANYPEQQLFSMHSAFKPLLAQMQQCGLLHWQADNAKSIRFASHSALLYLHGGWLEQYFYLVCQQLGLADCHAGVEITNDQNHKANIRNELDGLVCHNNRLLLVECKTARLGKDSLKDSQIIYKLDSIASQVGGQYCSRVLLSALPVNHQTQDQHKVFVRENALARDIHVVEGAELLQLKDKLAQWQQKGVWPNTGAQAR